MMPRYSMLNAYMSEIGYFTFWLSILSIFITYWFTVRASSKTAIKIFEIGARNELSFSKI